MKCEAHAQSDQMRCERCDLLWDMNDPDPPECKTAHDLAMTNIKHQLFISEDGSTPRTVDAYSRP